MGKKARRVIGLSLATLTGAAVISVGASPAFASSGCSIQSMSCTTGHVTAGRDNAVTVTARPGSGKVTCRVYDSYNGIEVGSVTANFWSDFESKSKAIEGLSSMYFAVCLQSSGSGGGGSLA
ncbi:hypothetical protein AB0M36_08070 [Actinoplanes sp. NPDC051346]|uniref:hypothetical protein n=1 Tax=Actinoplanes sp. NPDC051346 TaxID=3155048 RepID=UPI00343D5370